MCLKYLRETPCFFHIWNIVPVLFPLESPQKATTRVWHWVQCLREMVVSLQNAISMTQLASEDDENEDTTNQSLSEVLKILQTVEVV